MGGWRPTVGDPGFMGWFTVGSYFACAIVAFTAVWFHRRGGRRFLFFWTVIGLLMILLGVNKQLDLQSLLTEAGRQIAKAQGWMDQRRIVQFWFTAAFGTAALAGFLTFAFVMRHFLKRFMLAFTGLIFLLSYVFIRAASFEHFDQMLGFKLPFEELDWLLELTGIYLILLGGLSEILHLKQHPLK